MKLGKWKVVSWKPDQQSNELQYDIEALDYDADTIAENVRKDVAPLIVLVPEMVESLMRLQNRLLYAVDQPDRAVIAKIRQAMEDKQ